MDQNIIPKRLLHNQKGTSFVELLVSIVILALIVGSFLSVYAYATKTNIITHNLIDGSYVAQNCMEEIYSHCTSASVHNINDLKNEMTSMGFSYSNVGDDQIFEDIIEDYHVKVIVTSNAFLISSNLYKVRVYVYYDSAYSDLAAKMQNIVTID